MGIFYEQARNAYTYTIFFNFNNSNFIVSNTAQRFDITKSATGFIYLGSKTPVTHTLTDSADAADGPSVTIHYIRKYP